MLIYMQL